jgi:hypothetical protein
MLKAYKVKTDISVDDKPMQRVLRIGYGLTEEELPRVATTTWSFQDCLDNKVPTPAVKNDVTLFRNRPYVEIEYEWDHVERYYDFDHLTVERHYEPYEVTLHELLEDFLAEDVIQYLKERGMTACPILK